MYRIKVSAAKAKKSWNNIREDVILDVKRGLDRLLLHPVAWQVSLGELEECFGSTNWGENVTKTCAHQTKCTSQGCYVCPFSLSTTLAQLLRRQSTMCEKKMSGMFTIITLRLFTTGGSRKVVTLV